MGARTRSDSGRHRSNRGATGSPVRKEASMRRGAVLVVTILVATACVSVPTAPPELQAVAVTFKPSPGMARIHVYRAGGAFGGASKPSVAIDSQIVGRTGASPSVDRLAARLRGFGPLGILAMLAIPLLGNYPVPPFGAILVLLWVQWSRTPWGDIGYVRPKSWTRDLAVGIALGVAFKLLMKALVMPLLGAPPINQAYQYLTGNRAALPGAVYLLIAGGGFGEETVYRGFLFERFGKLFGSGASAKRGIVLLTAAWFALAHYPEQGLPGVEQALITGLVFGTIFVITGRILLPMVAHAVFDLTALAIIYWNLESKVAHLIFT